MEPRHYFYRLDEQNQIIPDPIEIEAVKDVALSQLETPPYDFRSLWYRPEFQIEFRPKRAVTYNVLQAAIYGVTTPLIPEPDPSRPYFVQDHNLPQFRFAWMGIGWLERDQKWVHTIVPHIRATFEVIVPSVFNDLSELEERLNIDVIRSPQAWTGNDEPMDLCWFPLDEITPLSEIMAKVRG